MAERFPAGVEVFYGHRVGERVDPARVGPDAGNTVTPGAVESWLEANRARRALSWNDLRTGSIGPEPAFLLTFDDGYRDNRTELLPLLERHDVPLLLFVTTGFVAREAIAAEERLARILRQVDELRADDGRIYACGDTPGKLEAYRSIRLELKQAGGCARDARLERLERCNGVESTNADESFVDWEELRRMAEHPLVTIGAHTHTHPLLTRAPRREAELEIVGSRERLEQQLGTTIETFAYPYGGHNLWVRRLVAGAGYRAAFSTESGYLKPGSLQRPWRIPRRDLADAVRDAA